MLPSRLFFDDFLDQMQESAHRLDCDIYEKENTYYVELDLPGFNKDDIKIELHRGNLTITAEKSSHEADENKKYFRQERKFYGKYERSFYLGDIVEEEVHANFENGILTIAIPKQIEENHKKQIEID